MHRSNSSRNADKIKEMWKCDRDEFGEIFQYKKTKC